MNKLTDDEILKAVDLEFEEAMGGDYKQIAAERRLAWDRYKAKPLGNEDKNSDDSKAVTSDVADVVDGIIPMLLRMFTTAENLVSFDPTGPEDVEQARDESDYARQVFFKQNKAFEIMHSWMFDAALEKIGVIMAWWDDGDSVEGTETYEGMSILALAKLLQDPDLELVEDDTTWEEDENGERMFNVRLNRKASSGRIRIENLPPDQYRISSDATGLDPNTARMVGREWFPSRSEAKEMGFTHKLVDELPAVDPTTISQGAQARGDKTDDRTDGKSQKSQEVIRLREAYIRLDRDGDGINELVQVYAGDGKLMTWGDNGEPAVDVVDRSPFHVICPHPLPHKHIGRSIAEKIIDVQEHTTTLLRMVLNNLYRTGKPGHAVWEQAIGETTIDDLLTDKLGAIRRFARPVDQAYREMTVPFTAGQTFPMLEYFDKVKRDRSGVSSDTEALNADSLKNIQTSVLSQALDVARLKPEAIARIFAETGFRSLFLHIRELAHKHQSGKVTAELRGEWKELEPRGWIKRENVTVNIGLGIASREQKQLQLDAIAARQEKIVQGGGLNLIVTPKNVYKAAADMVTNSLIPGEGQYFTDPGDQLAPPPSDEEQELQKREQEIQAAQQQIDNERQQNAAIKHQLEQREMELKHQRELQKLETDAQAAEDKFVVEMEKLETKAVELEQRAVEAERKAAREAEESAARINAMDAQAEQARAAAGKSLSEMDANDLELIRAFFER